MRSAPHSAPAAKGSATGSIGSGLLAFALAASALSAVLLVDLVTVNGLGLSRNATLRAATTELASLPVNYQTLSADSVRAAVTT